MRLQVCSCGLSGEYTIMSIHDVVLLSLTLRVALTTHIEQLRLPPPTPTWSFRAAAPGRAAAPAATSLALALAAWSLSASGNAPETTSLVLALTLASPWLRFSFLFASRPLQTRWVQAANPDTPKGAPRLSWADVGQRLKLRQTRISLPAGFN